MIAAGLQGVNRQKRILGACRGRELGVRGEAAVDAGALLEPVGTLPAEVGEQPLTLPFPSQRLQEL
jgi:hypothetical protein